MGVARKFKLYRHHFGERKKFHLHVRQIEFFVCLFFAAFFFFFFYHLIKYASPTPIVCVALLQMDVEQMPFCAAIKDCCFVFFCMS